MSVRSVSEVGWMTGLEPATSGATVRCSTFELHPPQGGSYRVYHVRTGLLAGDRGGWFDVGDAAVDDAHRGRVHVRGLDPLGVVHQFVGALNEFRRQLARDAAALVHRAEPQADDADVD